MKELGSMSRKQNGSPATVTQDAPTRARPRDAQGRELDAWGLPISGVARARRLAELGKPDPNFEPEAWAAPAVDGPALTENDNG